jgi:hypothetical protein
MNEFACIQDIVGDETHVFAYNNKSQLDCRELCVVFLDITVKYFQQLGVDQVKVFANHDADFIRLDRHDVNNLLHNLVPNEFRVASQERDVDFVVDVADVVLVCVFFVLETHFFVVF